MLIILLLVYVASVLAGWIPGFFIVGDFIENIEHVDRFVEKTGVRPFINGDDCDKMTLGDRAASAFFIALVLGTAHFFLIAPMLLILEKVDFLKRFKPFLAAFFIIIWFVLCYDSEFGMTLPILCMCMPLVSYFTFVVGNKRIIKEGK